MNEQENTTEHEAGRLERVREQTKEVLEKARDGVAAGASTVAEFTKTVATETRDRAGKVVEFVREAEPDAELKTRVQSTTESTLHQAGDRLSGVAPTIGRGAEAAAGAVGTALHYVARPLAVVLGVIAGTLGGWWKKAHDVVPQLPEAEEEACRAHFATITVLPAAMTYDRARTGYALGYIAARNPDYSGRSFEEVESDLRQGFAGENAGEYDTLREFTRYGYGRGAGGGAL